MQHLVAKKSNYYSEQQYNSAEEADCMIEEWPILRDRVSTHQQNELILVYSDLLKEACTELKSILIMTISASTAACERGFSAMNRGKSILRTRLVNRTLEDILRISVVGPSLGNFDAISSVKTWLSSANKRHLSRHKLN